jgi:branched-chain amino acid transport system substrate-binding protein
MLHRAVVVVVAMAMVVAACSGDDDESSSSTQPPSSTEPAPTDTVSSTEPATDSAPPAAPGMVLGFLRPAPGLLLDLSTAQQAALELAAEDIAAAGGVLGGPLEVLTVDEPPDGDVAAAVNEALDQGANGILGPVGSTSARAALPTLGERGSIACSGSATAPDLTADSTGVFFRTAISDSVTVQFVADQLTDRREAAGLAEGEEYRVTIVARDDDYGIQAGNGLASALLARGINANVSSYPSRRVIFTEEAADVAASNPDAVVMVSYAESQRLISDLLSAGVAATTLIGLDGSFDPRLAEASVPTDPTAVDGLEVIGTTGNRAFIDRLVAIPDTHQVIYGAQMYDCAIVMALAAQAAGSTDPAVYGPLLVTVTSEGVSCSTYEDCLANLEAGDDIDYEGVSGGIRFDENGDVLEARFTVARFTDATLEEVSTTDVDLDVVRQAEAFSQAIFVTRLQQVLTALGYYTGPIDGIYNDEVTAAVAALQADLGVPVTGVYDTATDQALRAQHANLTALLGDSVAGIQQLLADLGFYSGPIDGVMSAATVEAIRGLQRELGVPETGILDAATLRAAYERGLTTGSAPSTTEPPTTEPPSTEPPSTEPPPATTTTAPPAPVPEPEPSIIEVLRGDARFTTLVELIDLSGFAPDLSALGRVTVLAPTNDAFAAMDPAEFDALRQDPNLAATVLSYHILDSEFSLAELSAVLAVQTVLGQPITITFDGATVRFDDAANGIPPELPASNGSVIAIDAVLTPPEI